jgi:hypothetical protein
MTDSAPKPQQELPPWMIGRKVPKWAQNSGKTAGLTELECQAIRCAEYFTAAMVPGQNENISLRAETLGEARALAREVEAQRGKYGRRAVVYAIWRGNHYPVPADWPQQP